MTTPLSSASTHAITHDRLITDLRTMGLKSQDHIAVTLSLKRIGYVQGGPDAFLDALLTVLGSSGTLMMNTFSRPPEKLEASASDVHRSSYVFDHQQTPCWTGIVPETLRKRPSSIRSRHPLCSVTAIGQHARYLTAHHDVDASPFLPYARLAQIGGKYLSIGIGHRLVAIRHEAQRLAGFFNIVPQYYWVKHKDNTGTIKISTLRAIPCSANLHQLVPYLLKKDIFTIGKIGHAYALHASAQELLTQQAQLLHKDPTLTLCNRRLCLWCREFERRLNLYPKIRNPHLFQSNRILRHGVALMNHFRLQTAQGRGGIVPQFIQTLEQIL